MNNYYAYLDEYVIHGHHFSAPSLALLVLSMLLILAFEVWMLIDVLAYRRVPTKSRVAWAVGMFLIHPFVAMAYILVRSRYKRVKP